MMKRAACPTKTSRSTLAASKQLPPRERPEFHLIVAMKDSLVIFDAPYGELQSRWTIDAAKAKYENLTTTTRRK
jgi:hypothetical protein